MFYTYIIYSGTKDKFYIGVSENPQERLKKHNAKNKGFTNQAKDWRIVFTKSFDIRSEALLFEKQIKRWKSKAMVKTLINSVDSVHRDPEYSGIGLGVKHCSTQNLKKM